MGCSELQQTREKWCQICSSAQSSDLLIRNACAAPDLLGGLEGSIGEIQSSYPVIAPMIENRFCVGYVTAVGLLCALAAQEARAQPLPCSRLPAAEREIARRKGICVDPTPPAAKPIPNLPGKAPEPVTACPLLPRFTVPYDVAVQALDPSRFRPRKFEEPSSQPRGTILRQSAERLKGNLCWANFWVSDGSLVKVPMLKGATRDEAAEKLRAVQLAIDVVERPSDEPVGRVFAQDPDPNTDARRGSTVRVTIAQPILVGVPNVIGLSYANALARLKQFTVERAEIASARPQGEVTDQDPRPPARRPLRAQIKVLVSDGSLSVVPQVRQLALDAARRRLQDENRRLEAYVTQREDDAAPGVVLEQDPIAGREVRRGSTVRLVVSTGLPVPDVTGQPIDEAERQLVRFTVERTEIESIETRGRVLEQDPKPPARGAAGMRVALRLSDGSLVAVPNVHAQTLAAARRALQSVGLTATIESGPDRDDATVTRQDPPAGKPAKRASIVQLQVTPPSVNPLWYVAAGAALVATTALAWLILKPKPVPPELSPPGTLPVRVAARLDSALTDSRVEGAALIGPTVRVEARLGPGATEVHFSDGEPR